VKQVLALLLCAAPLYGQATPSYRVGVVSESGDMAYSTAEYTETYTDSATKKLVNIKGTNLSVWKKQADGSWKLAADSNPAGPTG
jgi:ketosteroid isomerase-like protein